ncbi:hypothetical protein C1N32_05395 [Vibrio diazotrophicus]|uniref:Uncharacterized protein n=1 Tax=Vibrio diazotrophicus TaxID=685 RepID=A0A2J8I4V5_VIBDI|nr:MULTISPECIES: hypothetical protein [Vibrio]MCF7361918.1 XRE family transcriptional regulator [Vibrio sp. A1-b2]PNI05539.1 hypothetical protein C1N32_05395 [Vibrio diazotrophicus]
MIKEFKTVLSEWLDKNNLTRSELIAHLQLYDYESFKGLDAITLSRWLNGKTTPHTHKQILVCKGLNEDLIQFIKTIDIGRIKSSSTKSKIVSEFIKLLDYINPTLSYKKVCSKAKTHVDIFDYQQHLDIFGDFYRNIPSIKKLTEDVYSLGDEVTYPCIRIKNNEDEMIGHWVGIEPLEKISSLSSFISLSKEEASEGYLINVAYYQNSQHFFQLISIAICFYLLAPRFRGKRTAYLLLSGYSVYEVTKMAFDAEDVKYYPPVDKKTRLGIYLVKIDITKIIANPIILPLVQEKLNCLEDCKENCNLCNLKSYSLC